MSSDSIDSRASSEWIPVSERLPDWDTTVMVALSDPEAVEPVWIGYCDEGWLSVDHEEIEVSHWRYLPDHPRTANERGKDHA